MTLDLPALAALLQAAKGMGNAERRWFDRGRHISLVPDNTGMGATLHTNHIANFAEKADCALTVSAVNALPALLAIATAAQAWRDKQDMPRYDAAEYHALIAAIDSARDKGER